MYFRRARAPPIFVFYQTNASTTMTTAVPNLLHPRLQSLCDELTSTKEEIPEERQYKLRTLSHYISEQLKQGVQARLVVVCTHNSRRSHIGQLWLATAAAYYGISGVETYSGGTEATALHPNAVAALRRAGWETLAPDTDATNPRYSVSWRADQEPYLAFSKRYQEAPNPDHRFAAVMVCTEADADCPVIVGCDLRQPLPYEDPKAYDSTPRQDEAYDTTVRLIGREMLWMMEQANLS